MLIMCMFPPGLFLIHEPLCIVPQDINLDPSTKSAPVDGESPKVDKPSSPQTERTAPNPRSPQAQKVREAPLVLAVLRLLQLVPPRAKTLHAPTQGRSQPSPPEHLPQAPSPMDSGLLVGLSMVKAHLCQSKEPPR
jgi:hypothetical protein